MEKQDNTIQSVDRAFKVLDVLYASEVELGVTEIAAKLDTHKSTIHRTLATLKKNGYVYQNQNSEKFGLGIRLYGLGLAVKDRLMYSMKSVLDPIAQELVAKYNEVLNYSILDASAEYPAQRLLYKYEPAGNVLKFTPSVGSITPAHSSAAGKALLSFCDNAYLQRYYGCPLKRFTENTIVDWDRLMNELTSIQHQGYAIDNEELEIGLTCVGVLVVRKRELLSAISLSGPSVRMRSYPKDEMVRTLQEAAQKIAGQILLN